MKNENETGSRYSMEPPPDTVLRPSKMDLQRRKTEKPQRSTTVHSKSPASSSLEDLNKENTSSIQNPILKRKSLDFNIFKKSTPSNNAPPLPKRPNAPPLPKRPDEAPIRKQKSFDLSAFRNGLASMREGVDTFKDESKIEPKFKSFTKSVQSIVDKVKVQLSPGEPVDLSSLSEYELAAYYFRSRPFSSTVTITKDDEQTIYFRAPNQVFYQTFGDKILGKGVVRPAKNLVTGEMVALKCLNKYTSKDDARLEAKIHSLMGTSAGPPILESGKCCIPMKLIIGRKFESELLDPLSKFDMLDLYNQCKMLIAKLHSLGFYHGDTNTGNFIVDMMGLVHMLDYGETQMHTMMDHKLGDFKKLASNVLDETKFREDCDELREIAKLDYLDPEQNLP
ncbi:hypothetical protein HDV02_000336 [Globomyces sp. JEL0801]|nr:hypothetical protein HDV02_000336 [Globomyces sp. JEL0801]